MERGGSREAFVATRSILQIRLNTIYIPIHDHVVSSNYCFHKLIPSTSQTNSNIFPHLWNVNRYKSTNVNLSPTACVLLSSFPSIYSMHSFAHSLPFAFTLRCRYRA
jgi:hypothetical protein